MRKRRKKSVMKASLSAQAGTIVEPVYLSEADLSDAMRRLLRNQDYHKLLSAQQEKEVDILREGMKLRHEGKKDQASEQWAKLEGFKLATGVAHSLIKSVRVRKSEPDNPIRDLEE